MPEPAPIAEGLFTWPADEPRLVGSRCRDCGVITFPRQASCPACTSVAVEERLLGRTGTLYTWTVQGFRPKPPYAGPEEFEPYGVGYVELPGEVLIEARLTVSDPACLAIGMPMELVVVPFGDKVTFAFAPGRGSGAVNPIDVAIVGIGIHPFGRHDGLSARAMGVYAVRAALRDAGVRWADVDFAFGGSRDGGNADTVVADLGLTGLPFVNVRNGCATGGSALVAAGNAVRCGPGRLGVVVGFDKHPPGAFGSDPAAYGLPAWYGKTGLMVTTQFFGMKIQRYLHDHGMSRVALARVAAKAFRNGARNPNAWRRKPLSEEEILAAPMVAHPLTQYMFCSPGEGAVALVVAPAAEAGRYTDRPVHLRSAVVRTRRFGSFEVYSPSLALDRADSPTVDAARAAFAAAGIGPDEVDLAQLQDTESGAEIMHLAECGLCKDGEQEEWLARGAYEIDGALPVNTDGGCLANGEPIGASGLRQVHEVVLQLQGRAGNRQVPGTRVGFTHVYGAPGVSACTVLSR